MKKYQNTNEQTHCVMGRIVSMADKEKERVADGEREWQRERDIERERGRER